MKPKTIRVAKRMSNEVSWLKKLKRWTHKAERQEWKMQIEKELREYYDRQTDK